MVSACGQQRDNDTHILRCLMVAAEEIVFPAERNGTDLVLGKIVVYADSSIFKVAHHVVPSNIGIACSLSEQCTLRCEFRKFQP